MGEGPRVREDRRLCVGISTFQVSPCRRLKTGVAQSLPRTESWIPSTKNRSDRTSNEPHCTILPLPSITEHGEWGTEGKDGLGVLGTRFTPELPVFARPPKDHPLPSQYVEIGVTGRRHTYRERLIPTQTTDVSLHIKTHTREVKDTRISTHVTRTHTRQYGSIHVDLDTDPRIGRDTLRDRDRPT